MYLFLVFLIYLIWNCIYLNFMMFWKLGYIIIIYRLKISTQATRCDNALLSQSKTCSDRNNESSPDFHCKVLNRLYKKIFYIFDGVSSSEHGHGGHVFEVIYARETTTANARSYFKHVQTLKWQKFFVSLKSMMGKLSQYARNNWRYIKTNE